MDMTLDMREINVVDPPIEVDYGQWIIDHPECDTVCQQIGTSPMITVYAYAKSKKGNDSLHKYKDVNYSDKEILQGVSLNGIRQLI